MPLTPQKNECPGPNRKKALVPDIVECPACGGEIELWSDEKKARCPDCSEEFTRDQLTAAE